MRCNSRGRCPGGRWARASSAPAMPSMQALSLGGIADRAEAGGVTKRGEVERGGVLNGEPDSLPATELSGDGGKGFEKITIRELWKQPRISTSGVLHAFIVGARIIQSNLSICEDASKGLMKQPTRAGHKGDFAWLYAAGDGVSPSFANDNRASNEIAISLAQRQLETISQSPHDPLPFPNRSGLQQVGFSGEELRRWGCNGNRCRCDSRWHGIHRSRHDLRARHVLLREFHRLSRYGISRCLANFRRSGWGLGGFGLLDINPQGILPKIDLNIRCPQLDITLDDL